MKKRSSKQMDAISALAESPISGLLPENGKVLLTGGGKEFVERIGVETIRSAVHSVLIGQNIRSQTEPLSRRRIAQVSGALIVMLAKGYTTIENFQGNVSKLAANQLRNLKAAKVNDNLSVWPSQWLLGLTGKSVQNVLSGSHEPLDEYVEEFEKALRDSATHCLREYGDYKMTLGYVENGSGHKVNLDWEGIVRLTTVIGAQTLAIRGSDKSMFGKLFEKLILGSVLTILGFKKVVRGQNKETEKVFWLSDSSENRESDATLLISQGKLVRFDIGFIGSGNSEISKDKLSRFASKLEIDGVTNYSLTFIIVDKLPDTTKTREAAKSIGAEIIQMSMQVWPRELAEKLNERFGLDNPFQDMSDSEISGYLNEKIKKIQIQDFLNNVILEDIQDQTVSDQVDNDIIIDIDDDE